MDDDGARALPQPLARAARGRPDQEPHLQGHRQRRRHRRHRVLPAAVLRGDGDRLRLPRRRRDASCCTASSNRRFQRFWRTRASATAWCRATRSARPCRPETLFLTAEQFYRPRERACAALAAAMRRQPRTPTPSSSRCRPWPWCAAPTSRWRSSRSTSAARRTACWCWPRATGGARACSTSCAPATCRRRPSTRWRNSRPATRSSASRPRRWPPASAGSKQGIDFITETELFAAGPDHAPAQEAGAGQRRRGADQGPVGAQRRRPGGAHPARHRPLPGPGQPGPGRGRDRTRSSCTSSTRTRRKLYVPVSQLHLISRYTGVSADEAPLHKLGSRPVGEGQAQGGRAGARHRRRTAQHLCPPRRARGPRVPLLGAGLRGVRQRLSASRRPLDQNAAIHAVIAGHDLAAADGPAGLRRRRLRQDRGGAARRVHRGARAASRWRSWCRRRCSPSSTSRPSPTASEVAGEDRASCRASAPAKEVDGDAQGPGRRQRRHRRRHPQAAQQADVKFKNLGLRHHRRGAPLRRAPQGGDEGAARRGGRAHAHRDADPAHAGHGARGPARLLGHRHRAAAAPGDQDLRSQRSRNGIDPRGGAARAQARRPGLLPAQRGRDHREPARASWRRCCPRRASRWPTARCASASWSA